MSGVAIVDLGRWAIALLGRRRRVYVLGEPTFGEPESLAA
jgi:hypothetical protein